MQISAVIINYNSANFLRQNLNSLLSQSQKFNQILVIDNLSIDHSKEVLESFPAIKKIYLSTNSGYAKAANLGIQQSNGELILIANADTYFEEKFNEKVLKKFTKEPQLGLLSPLIMRFDKKTVDSAGQTYSLSLHAKEIGFNRNIGAISIVEGPRFSVCGAATVFHKHALEKLKIDNEYYDEDFFIFWEDFDIGWRANLLGIKVHFLPQAIAYHYRSATLKRNLISKFSLSLARSSFIKYHLVKNRYLTLIKNFRIKQFWWSIPFILLKDLIWVTLLTISSPKIIIKLVHSIKLFKRGFLKRKLIKKKSDSMSER